MRSQLSLFLTLVALTILATFLYFQLVPQPVDVLYVGARVYTVDKANTVVDGIATRGDRIVAVGSAADMVKELKPKRVVDLAGKTVVPGLIDAHVHLLSLGVARLTLDLVGTKSEDRVADLVRERVGASEPGQWIRGRGWDQNEWRSRQFPSHEILDRVAPNNPVYLMRVDGHAAWVNKKALEIAGITSKTPDPDGGRFLRDARGNPTGVLIDNAMEVVGKFLPPPSDKEMEEAIGRAVQECLSYGLTCVHDMGVEEEGIETYKRLIDAGNFPFRVYAALSAPGETWEKYVEPDSSGSRQGPLIGYGGSRLWVRAIKLYIDGALGSRGAALIEPYSDEPDNRGLTVMSEGDLRKAVDEALANGFQVCTHAIGDRGNNIVLNIYEAALQAHAAKDPRLRIEHAQVLAPNDIPRFHELGVIPSMQPTHCTSDMYWAEARLGPTRVRGAYAWRSLLNTGVIIPGGSDFPVESPNPLFGIYAAITRQDHQGKPRNADDVRAFFQLSAEGITDTSAFDGGWYASQKMTREEALRAFTAWAAYAGFQEDLLGSLERGKLADFVVLSKDIMTVPPLEILNTTVERTILGGSEVYRREQVSMRSASPGPRF
jgi:predicted amidohydrolase YtcJ